MKTLVKFLLIGFLSTACIGCSGDGDNGVNPTDVSLTPAEQQAILYAHETIAASADSLLLTNDPLDGLEGMVSTYKQNPEVENAWLSDNSLYVKFKKAGVISWTVPSEVIIPPYGTAPSDLAPALRPAGGMLEPIGNGKACLVNQQYNDEDRQYCRDIINELSSEFTQNDFEVTVVNGADANLGFFDSDLKNFGAIFYISHGSYDGTHTWLLTGQEGSMTTLLATHLIAWIRGEISLGSVTEKIGGVSTVVTCYTISNSFFNSRYDEGDFPHSLIYLVACQSFKATTQLAEAFHAKGVGVTIGWDETNCLGQSTGKLLFDGLLGGEDLATAFSALPSEARTDHCTVQDGANLTYYPGSGGSIYLVEPKDAEIMITSPTDGATYATRLLTLSGALSGAVRIDYGTVELNGVTTSLTTTSALGFSQSIVIGSSANTIRINCYGTRADGKSVHAYKELTVSGDFPMLALYTELRWNTNYSDVDFHLLPPGATMDQLWTSSDCYYANKKPTWGGELDVDDVDGYGPEHITLPTASTSGTYRLFVHYYASHFAGPTDAFVSVSANNAAMIEFGPYRVTNDGGNYHGDLWEVCTISYPSGVVTPVNQYYYLGQAVAGFAPKDKPGDSADIKQ